MAPERMVWGRSRTLPIMIEFIDHSDISKAKWTSSPAQKPPTPRKPSTVAGRPAPTDQLPAPHVGRRPHRSAYSYVDIAEGQLPPLSASTERRTGSRRRRARPQGAPSQTVQ